MCVFNTSFFTLLVHIFVMVVMLKMMEFLKPLFVHGHRKAELKVFVEHFSTKGDPLAKHVHGHETQGFAVHQKSVQLDRGQTVQFAHTPDPVLNVFAHPRSWV